MPKLLYSVNAVKTDAVRFLCGGSTESNELRTILHVDEFVPLSFTNAIPGVVYDSDNVSLTGIGAAQVKFMKITTGVDPTSVTIRCTAPLQADNAQFNEKKFRLRLFKAISLGLTSNDTGNPSTFTFTDNLGTVTNNNYIMLNPSNLTPSNISDPVFYRTIAFNSNSFQLSETLNGPGIVAASAESGYNGFKMEQIGPLFYTSFRTGPDEERQVMCENTVIVQGGDRYIFGISNATDDVDYECGGLALTIH